MKNSTEIPSNERMEEAANLWKIMDQKDKEAYLEKTKQVSMNGHFVVAVDKVLP